MKNTKHILLVIALIASVSLAAYVKQYGKLLTAGTGVGQVTAGVSANPTASRCSVVNIGDNIIYFAKNIATNTFIATNSIPVPSGYSYEFFGTIHSISYGTLVSTSQFTIAFE